jgi:hypothetical protein
LEPATSSPKPARADDFYSVPTSRWDCAARNGSQPLIYAAIVAVLAMVVLVASRRSRAHWRSLGLILGGLACGLVLVTVLAIGIGH